MNKNMKSYVVAFAGQQYTIVSDESQDHIDQVIHIIQRLLDEIIEAVPGVDGKKMLALALMRMASQCLHQQKELEHQSNQQLLLVHTIDKLQALFGS